MVVENCNYDWIILTVPNNSFRKGTVVISIRSQWTKDLLFYKTNSNSQTIYK